MTYSKPCRSTLNGFSAACGKVGALLGTSLFLPYAEYFGDNAVMLTCAGISMLGFALTWFNVDEQLENNRELKGEESEIAPSPDEPLNPVI
eukprot:CAMPEP_0116823962 /NCGR_PEP_ID=MMETSP0418-20121206/1132_1 /TAXON_ID=1158023 /ORGANISM="Astrosyne radiata, Strain 13vi08-1A" /LENGTH=90 /DNA_ID=CAMNT_0004452279 /DNA_START=70 /DNA_END=342 /DNA_ORIENTATION=+